ncbi:permease [Jonesia quinghaiensis]|uniref:permease n=1 Tax=Jonesia quinghaiensis TaxID=262806 RepID=UPI000421174E|nr:permease [Jonesia quinghaiensis]
MVRHTVQRLPIAVRLVLLALGAVALYTFNEQVWDAAFDLAGWNYNGMGFVPAAHFFLYDTAKIFLLLTAIVFAVGLLRASLNTDRVRDWLEGKGLVVGLLLAIVLGVVTPFCSCSSIPLFIGFVAAGIPLSITLTFLIASPLVSEIAAVLIATHFGWQIAVAYVMAGATIAFVIGLTLSRFHLEPLLEPLVTRRPAPVSQVSVPAETVIGASATKIAQPRVTWALRTTMAWDDVRDIVGKVWPWIIVGVGIGAAIHGWVPGNFFAHIAGADNIFAVPLVSLAAVPLYANGGAVIPIAEALWVKGLPVGTMLAFIMSAIALSIPEAIMLRRVMKPRLLAIFFGSVTLGIIVTGYFFNLVFS